MKPFSLEEYLKNPSRKVVTKDGRKVRIICTDAKGLCPIVRLVDYGKYEVALNVTKNGKIDGVLDLFFASEKKESWVNIYRDLHANITYTEGYILKKEKEAKENARDNKYISTVKIEWEEQL